MKKNTGRKMSKPLLWDDAFELIEKFYANPSESEEKEIAFREITEETSQDLQADVQHEFHESEVSLKNADLPDDSLEEAISYMNEEKTVDYNNENNIKSAKGLYYQTQKNLFNIFRLIKDNHDFSIDSVSSDARNMVSHIRVEANSWMQLLYKIEKGTAYDSVMHIVKHSLDTAIIAIRLGIGLKLKDESLIALASQTCLADVGMLKLPPEIMNQPKLNRKDISLIREHSAYGYKILSRREEPYKSIAETVYQVHERYDGSGYPNGLKGKDISEHSLIIGIADMFAALLHPRAYRERRLPFEAIKEIIATAKEQFPKHIIKALVNEFSAFPEGLFVKLNSDEVGKVITVNRLAPLSPVVKILYNAKGKLQNPKTIDLMKDHCLYITSGFYGEDD